MRVVRWALLALLVALAWLTVDAARLGLSTTPVIAQAVGLRAIVALLLLVVAVPLLALVVRRPARDRRPRVGRRVAAGLAAVLLIGAATTHLAVVGSRGLSSGTVPTVETETAGQLTVLTINVRRGGGDLDVDALVALIVDAGADVVAVAESTPPFRDRLTTALSTAGTPFAVFDGEATSSPAYGSALLVSAALGDYREVATDVAGVVRVEPVTGGGPGIATAHPPSLPVLPVAPRAFAETRRWTSELVNVRTIAASMPGGVILGDLNATLDHGPLDDLPGGYVDAAAVAGTAGHGTYPSWLPAPWGTAIDHVLLDGDAWRVEVAAIVDVAGTDHRAVVVRLTSA